MKNIFREILENLPPERIKVFADNFDDQKICDQIEVLINFHNKITDELAKDDPSSGNWIK